MKLLEPCPCGTSRVDSTLICNNCKKSYPLTAEELSWFYDEYLNQKISRIRKGDMYAAEQLIHFYEGVDPQVSEIIKAMRDAKND